ncbi:MAG TPA: tetratricopeptide repeat protein [Opitutaceae bacterium]|nr:tetratricopeptide repeat protein [Opitutaceae bacterium]
MRQIAPAVFALCLCLQSVCTAGPDLAAARQAIAARRDAEARALLLPLIAAQPADAESLYLLGACESRLSELAPAVEHLAAAVALAPDNADYQSAYGNACLRHANKTRSLALTKRGLAALQRAVELAPDCLEAREGLYGFYSRAPWFVGGDSAKAAAQLAEIERLDTGRALALRVGHQLHRKAYAEAFALCEAALRADPRDPSALLALGQTAAQSGERLDRGAEALETCLALPEKTAGLDRAEVRYRLAQIRSRQGNPAAARAEAQAALALSPDHVGAKTLLAQVP